MAQIENQRMFFEDTVNLLKEFQVNRSIFQANKSDISLSNLELN